MGMKFLNKKSWHPATFQNQERVWKAEQKHKDEEKKMAELQKQVREEREREEFRQLQIRAGVRPQQERLDFLYESGLGVGKPSDAPAAPSTQEYLLGKPVEDAKTAEASGKDFSQPGALFQQSEDPASKNDAWRKLHSDPLLAIKQQEQAALAKIKENPVQMMMLKQQAAEKKNHKKEEKRRAKEERRAERKRKRDERKKRRRGGSSESESDSDSDDDKPAEPVVDRREKSGDGRPMGGGSTRAGDLKPEVRERSPQRGAAAYEKGGRGGRRGVSPRPSSRMDDQPRHANYGRGRGGDIVERERGQPPPRRDGYDRRDSEHHRGMDRYGGRSPDRKHHLSSRREHSPDRKDRSSNRRDESPDRRFRGERVRDGVRRRQGRPYSPDRQRRSPDRYRNGGVHRRGERSPLRTERGNRDGSPGVPHKRQRHDSSEGEPEPKPETREREKTRRQVGTRPDEREDVRVKEEAGKQVDVRRRRHDSSDSEGEGGWDMSGGVGARKHGERETRNGEHVERDPFNGDAGNGNTLGLNEDVADPVASPFETGRVSEGVKAEAVPISEGVKDEVGRVSERVKKEADDSDDEPGRLRGYGLIPGRGGLQLPAKRTGDAPPVPYKKPEEPVKPPPRVKYVPGKLSAEEKARRLAEMQQDADVHESDRFHRLKRVAEKEEREDAAAAKAAAAKAAAGKGYLGDLEKSAYGLEKGGSVEDSIRRRSHFREKGPAAGSANAFRR